MKKYYLKKSAYQYVVFLWLSMAVLLSMFLIPIAIFIRKDIGDSFGWFLAGVMIVMTLLNIPLTILNIYISISEKSIKYKMYIVTVIAKWEDFEGLVKSTTAGIYINQEGLLFAKAEIEQKPRSIIFLPSRELHQVFIPLSWFSDNWRDSDVTQQLKQYAPQLFEKK